MCTSTNSGGNYTFTSLIWPFISLSHSYTLHFSLTSSAVTSVVPYPFPLSGLVSSTRTDALAMLNAPISPEDLVLFPIVNLPFTIQGYITDNNNNPFSGLTVQYTQPTGSVESITDSTGLFVFNQQTQGLTSYDPSSISVSLTISGESWFVDSSNWVTSGGNAVLSLSTTQYGPGITTLFNLTLSIIPVPPSSPPPTSSPSSTTPLTPATSGTPSGTNPSVPFPSGTTPTNSSASTSNNGLLGIGQDASYAVIAFIAFVVLAAIIIVIVVLVKKASDSTTPSGEFIPMERV